MCGLVFRTRPELYEHKKTCNINKIIFKCPYCEKEWLTTKSGYSIHIKSCYKNPNRVPVKGHPVSEKTKQKISETRKQKIASGEINIVRTLKHPSYPEQWLINVLMKKFNMEDNKDYIRELTFHRYFLDFAWPEKKLCIELDGRQHCEEDRKRRDQLKDGLLKDEGWLEIRVDWGWVKTHTKQFVDSLSEFFNKNSDRVNEINHESLSYLFHRDVKKYKRLERIKEAQKVGQVDSMGRVCSAMISNEEWERRKNVILNCGVDITKFGWVGKVEKATGLSKRVIEATIKKLNIPYFRRKQG